MAKHSVIDYLEAKEVISISLSEDKTECHLENAFYSSYAAALTKADMYALIAELLSIYSQMEKS